MPQNSTRSEDCRDALKLSIRSYLLVALGSFFWHLPIGSEMLTWLSRAIAAAALILAALALLVSTAAWRNLLWQSTLGRRQEWRGGKAGSALIILPPLVILVALALGIFVLIGAGFDR